ncbi:hypothetical protein Tco_1206622 [Tanacetum coccineum]
MRFNEIYKFNDVTLTNILEALDYIVKEYKVNRLNPGMNMEFWTDKDVTRSKEFIHEIERRLKTRSTRLPNKHIISAFSQNRRDLPRENPLISVEVIGYDIKRSKCKNKGIVPTEMELELEQTQQGFSHEVSNIRVIPKYHSEDRNLARAKIKQALGSYKDGDGVILFRQRQVHYRMLILHQQIQRNHESSILSFCNSDITCPY